MSQQSQPAASAEVTTSTAPPHTTTPFPPAPLIALKTCVIRPYHPQDAESLAKHGDSRAVAQWMTNMFPHPYTLDNARTWIDMNLPKDAPAVADSATAAGTDGKAPAKVPPTVPSEPVDAVAWPRQLCYAIAVDDECVGSIGLKPGSDVHARAAEVGYWVAEAAWGRGIATEALRGWVEWVFGAGDRDASCPGLERLGAFVYSGNGASGRVLEKCGFRREGTMRRYVWKWGKFHDLEMYGLLREEWLEGRK